MKSYIITGLAAALFTLSAAQQTDGMPACAEECSNAATPAECGMDPECVCGKKEFVEEISCCISKSCEKEDQEITMLFAKSLCESFGVSNFPETASCAADAENDGDAAGAESTGDAAMTSAAAEASGTDLESTASSSEAEGGAASTTGPDIVMASDPASNLVAQGMGVMGFAALGAVALM